MRVSVPMSLPPSSYYLLHASYACIYIYICMRIYTRGLTCWYLHLTVKYALCIPILTYLSVYWPVCLTYIYIYIRIHLHTYCHIFIFIYYGYRSGSSISYIHIFIFIYYGYRSGSSISTFIYVHTYMWVSVQISLPPCHRSGYSISTCIYVHTYMWVSCPCLPLPATCLHFYGYT
jgi:hypothetical protein